MATCALAVVRPALAQPERDEAPPEEPAEHEPAEREPVGPWAVGVTPEQRETAQRLLEEATALHLDKKYSEALVKYRKAIEAWDHPGIRFNMVRCLILLERPVEAYENVVRALQYGAAPFFEKSQYSDALAFKQLLLGQVAEVTIACSESSARVRLDGREVMSCPGEETRRVSPGEHQVVASKEGYLPVTYDVMALPGKAKRVDIRMVSLEDAATRERRWARWKPWAVVGAGAVIAAVGVPLQLKARSDFERYDEEITLRCVPTGCLPEQLPIGVKNLESNALLERRLATGAFVGGGAVVAAGIALLILNRERTVVPEQTATAHVGVEVMPVVSSREAGVGLRLSF